MESLFFLFCLGAGVYFWFDSNQAKAMALHFARRECQKEGVQLLDQTVQRVRLSASRDSNDQWRLWREYRFDYSIDGVNRYQGKLVLLGRRLLRSALETSDPVIH